MSRSMEKFMQVTLMSMLTHISDFRGTNRSALAVVRHFYSVDGSKPYTESTLANDTTGLMDVLKIPKSGVVGYSLGSYIAQQVMMMHLDKVNSLVLIDSSCGGKDHTPKPPEFIKLQSEIVNQSLNHITKLS